MRKFLLCLILFFAGCGKFQEKFGRLAPGETSVRLALSGMNSPGAVLPGLMVYASRVENGESRASKFLPSEMVPANWIIPNGNYNFYAFGYTAAGFSGVMHCGLAQNVALTGGSKVVTLVLDDQGACGNPPFSPPNHGNTGGNTALPLKIAPCAASGGDIAMVSAPSSPCNGSGGRPASGTVASVRISFLEISRWNTSQPAVQTGNGWIGPCLDGPYASTGTLTGRTFPLGPFPLQIETFASAGCATFAGSYTMTNGVVASGGSAGVRFMNADSLVVTPALPMINTSFVANTASYLFFRVY